MKMIVALIIVFTGLGAGLSACHKEERDCCAKIEPPYQLAEESASATSQPSNSP